MNGYVSGEGPRDAKIVIVGEAPGKKEEQEGRPFVGGSGMLLNDMLVRVGINRFQECYVTNVMKIRPKGNYFGQFYRDPKTRRNPSPALTQGIKLLHEEIKAINPNLVIALGGEALRALTGKRKISHWRGSILSSPVGKVVATFHPAAILRLYEHRAIAELDLKRCREESYTADIVLPEHDFYIDPHFDLVMDWLTTVAHNATRHAGDIETTTRHVRCLGLASSSKEAISIPFISNQHTIRPGTTTILCTHKKGETMNSHWSAVEETAILEKLDIVFKRCEFIFQNYPFDSTILLRDFGLVVDKLFMDTMVAQHTCYSELPKGLKFMTSIYTRIPYYAEYDASSDLSTWTYNCFDCVATHETASVLEKEMYERDLWKFYRELAQPIMETLAVVSNTGIGVDLKLRDQMLKEEENHLLEIKANLLKEVGHTVNPNSPKQMQSLMYDEWKLPIQRSRKGSSKGKPTTDEDAIDALAIRFPKHKTAFDLILDYRGTVKLIGTYLQCLLDPRGRMVCWFHATGTVEGRLSSSATIFDEGGNMQNIPRGKFRRMYIAIQDGYILIKVDLSQAEMRVVAWVAHIRTLIDLFKDPTFDVHKWNATLIYGGTVDDITKHQRQQAKHCLHSANYRGGPSTAVKHAKIPYQEAKHALAKYTFALPDLTKWWSDLEETISTTRILRTPLGRERVFLGRLDMPTFRSGTAFIPAGTVGDQVNRALVNIVDEFSHLDYNPRVLLQVHDELVAECPNDPTKIKECVGIMVKHLEEPIFVEGEDEPLIIPADVSVGPNWYDMESYPHG